MSTTVADQLLQRRINGFIAVADRWRKWTDPRLVLMVPNNGDLTW